MHENYPAQRDNVCFSMLRFQCLFSMCRTNEELLLVRFGGNRDIEEADHHFIEGLIAPVYGDSRVGIVGIVF